MNSDRAADKVFDIISFTDGHHSLLEFRSSVCAIWKGNRAKKFAKSGYPQSA